LRFSYPLTNGWVADSALVRPGYTKSIDGFAHLRGVATEGAMGTVIGVLPVGFRPIDDEFFDILTMDNTIVRLEIRPNGYIQIMTGKQGWANLSGITFRAEN
jgi:hypothetical protein